jgi:uncharacterized SAM-binding protein YcdF (DUF218 family)
MLLTVLKVSTYCTYHSTGRGRKQKSAGCKGQGASLTSSVVDAQGLMLMLTAGIGHKCRRLSKTCLWSAIAVLLIGGNEWIVRWATIPLEWRIQAPDPIPHADAIVVLGGALRTKEWPRRTVEVSEAGDRVLYAFDLYRQKKAPLILCTGGIAEPGVREFSEAEDMRAMLETFGVPSKAILVETNSLNTRENASYCRPLIDSLARRRTVQPPDGPPLQPSDRRTSLLLVTSALHMPRALGIFRHQFLALEIIPAPTDYLFTRSPKIPTREVVQRFIPSGENLMKADEMLHEYIGLVYYRLRGWI